jgi:uncharacterized membrane protein (UPF0182 family)
MLDKISIKLFQILLVCLAIVVIIYFIADFMVDVFWFQELGYLNILLKKLQTQIIAGFLIFSLSLVFIFSNLNIADKLKWSSINQPNLKKLHSQKLKFSFLLGITLILSILISSMIFYYGQLAYSSWQIDYTLPKVTPTLPSPFTITYLRQIIPQLYHHLWQLIILVLTIIFIIKKTASAIRLIAITISLLFAAVIAGNWTVILQWFAATQFNQLDPVFHHDLSFYIFRVPGFRLLDFWLGGLFLYTLITITLIYLLADNSLSQGKFAGFSRSQLRHIYSLIGAMFTVLAWRHWFLRYDLLYSKRSVTYGASYTDIHVKIPLETTLAVVAILISLWLFWKALTGAGRYNVGLTQFEGRKDRIGRRLYKTPFSLVPFYLYITILIGGIVVGFLVQYLIVQPNELAREKPYLLRNIELTRQGFNLDQIKLNTFDPKGELNQEVIANNPLTIKNIRLWGTLPLLQTNRQLQQIRPYYKFYDADIDRYAIKQSLTPGETDSIKQQVIIAARELDYNGVPAQAQTWVNEHLVFTHGFGFTMSPVNLVDEGGLPYYFVKDINSSAGNEILNTSSDLLKYSVPIGKPRIYYGELTDTYIMTSTKVKEFDFPNEQENAYNVYDGTGGINIGPYWRRLVFAIYLKDWQMLFTENFTPETRLLLRRNINVRLRTLAPFLRYDQNPYMVVADADDANQGDSDNYLHWVMDAYTTSPYYPYSDPGDNKFNYIRNSVKIVADAYHGDVQFYITDPSDPIIQTWAKIFGVVFQPLANMPQGLQSHIRYPQDLFSTQSESLLTYHMLDPQVFYNREDQWRIPKEVYGSEMLKVEPYYLIIKLPTAQQEAFILVHVYTPNSRNNLIAMLFGLSDGEDYGKAVLYVLPRERLVFGIEQIEARINQDPIISQQISLWNRQDSKVVQGNLLVIPIEKSLLYVEPIYLEAVHNSLPTLVRVVLVYENKIVMAESLSKGLEALFEPKTTEDPAIIRPLDEINSELEPVL